jgi:hypothetical protein
VRDRLARVLPAGVRIVSAEQTSDDVAPGESNEVRGMVVVMLEDADGARGSLEVTLNAGEQVPPPEPDTITVQDPNGDDVTYGVATRVGEPDEEVGVDRLGDITVITATALVRGGWVSVSTANTLDDKWGAESRASTPDPLLTRRQVGAIAAADVWVD